MENFLKLLQDGITIFLGVMIEAIPFILLGVIVSSFLAHYVKEEWIVKYIPKNKFLAILAACFFGFLFPVCECGNVPVARRMIAKGVTPHLAIAYLLSAPVMNPIVILATWAAFSYMPEIVYLRVIFTLIITVFISFLYSLHPDPTSYLVHSSVQVKAADHLDHFHPKKKKSKLGDFFATMNLEFLEMLAILTQGAVLSAVIQVAVPRNIILGIGTGPVLSILVMMIFAVIISVCSNVDAFIALSYANTFTAGSLLAFLVYGPMIDLKAFVMLRSIFKWRTVVNISVLAFLMTFLMTLIYNFHFS